MMKRLGTAFVILLCAATGSPAQYQSTLSTTYAQNNGCYGNLFDVTAVNDVTICSFDVHLEAGTSTVQVWAVTGGGSWNQPGVIGNPGAWTMLGQATVSGAGIGNPTPLNLSLGYTIPQGTVQGFSIFKTVAATPLIRYTNGSAYGNVLASNADMTIHEGGGDCTPGSFTPNTVRNWNGTILYEVGQNTGCQLPRPPTEFQVNQPGSSLTIDAIPDPGFLVPIQVASLVNTQHSLDFASTNSGLPWDLLVAPASAQGFSSLGIATTGGQTINVDPAAPGAFFLNGLFGATFPSSTFSIPFAIPSPGVLSAQMAVFDGTHPDGFVVSHAIQHSAEVCNVQQGFDNLPQGPGVAPPGWVNPSSGVAWTVDAGGTTSAGTGPTTASSAPNYMYCETSSPNTGANFVMDTCDFDLTALGSFTLNFSLSRIGATIGTLNVWQDDDGAGTFGTLLMTYTGPDPSQSQGGVEWSAESIPFVPGGTSTVAFRFDYTGGSSFTADLAIDDFNVQ